MVQSGVGCVMVWGMFSWHTLGPLIPIEQRLNAIAYLNIVADQVHPFMATGGSDPVLDVPNKLTTECIFICFGQNGSSSLNLFGNH